MWRGMGEGVKREEPYAYLMPIYAITLQKPSEYCNYPLAKINIKNIFLVTDCHFLFPILPIFTDPMTL